MKKANKHNFGSSSVLWHISANERGIAAIELALCLPFLVIVLFGTIEVTRAFLAVQKVENAVSMLTDAVSRSDQQSTQDALTPAGLNSLYTILDDMMSPFDVNNVIVYISDVSVGSSSTNPILNWQSCSAGVVVPQNNSIALPASAIGTPVSGTTTVANMSNFTASSGQPLSPGEEVIVGEIYYDYTPIFIQNIIGTIQMQKTVYYIPRAGSLSSVSGITCNYTPTSR